MCKNYVWIRGRQKVVELGLLEAAVLQFYSAQLHAGSDGKTKDFHHFCRDQKVSFLLSVSVFPVIRLPIL